ncbi:tumor protein p53-inducible nuclear protein 2 isoform X1 [Takifugu rubripes]|uniref:Tumor protein p53 inducible nuclear protein 2 n=1 Tax=Takifugu rubripes TaxID=31033 RepID=A0A3B5KL89_TAKRU|nr:tumor protein p53-inducible nuclear protein 2 isoform X1 [Takifugu rubripes]XP_029688984.1 tumor protein p53-inducible nuclear protein 2 isoform X1 [Takifugu rubripes]XP_029688985.1 tumor protein p53-inducible nuclear protein 2 isoform X1 [Takifugu rubripes]|eukprot:XP_011600776.1 PREDICTED: tumor protein p53-inducible nuclear protein 2 isoform X1 [Takifugu rubripes]
MFQRLTNLLFGEVEEVAAEIKGAKPCMTEADEEGWMIVNLPGDSDPVMEDETGTRPNAQTNQSNCSTRTRTESPTPAPHMPQKRRRTHKTRARGALASSDPLSGPSASLTDLGATTPVTLPRRARLSTPSSPSMSPSSGKGAPAETSPMEDLLIEHPSMSVYVSSNNFSMVSNSNLSVVGEESIVSLASSMSRVAEPAALPSSLGTVPTRVSRGAAAQAGALAKVTQVSRVQRSKARIERRHLSRNRIQRQNLTREQVPRHAAHARKSFLHQPSKRNFCH